MPERFVNGMSPVFGALSALAFFGLVLHAEGYRIVPPLKSDRALAQAIDVLNAREGEGADTMPVVYSDTPKPTRLRKRESHTQTVWAALDRQ
jgi:hypothetical protein